MLLHKRSIYMCKGERVLCNLYYWTCGIFFFYFSKLDFFYLFQVGMDDQLISEMSIKRKLLKLFSRNFKKNYLNWIVLHFYSSMK